MNFPNGFKEKYQHLLGEDAAAFFATFEQEAVSAFRTNPLKEAQDISVSVTFYFPSIYLGLSFSVI